MSETRDVGDFIIAGILALTPGARGKAKYRYETLLDWEKCGNKWYVDIMGAACLEEFKAHHGKLPKDATQLRKFYQTVVKPHLPDYFCNELRRLCTRYDPLSVLLELSMQDRMYAQLERNVIKEFTRH